MAGPYVTERDVVITTISVGSVNMGTETQCPSLESANDYSARLQCCVEAEFARNSYFDELGPVSLLAISATAVPLEEQAVESPPPSDDESLLSSGIFWAGLARTMSAFGDEEDSATPGWENAFFWDGEQIGQVSGRGPLNGGQSTAGNVTLELPVWRDGELGEMDEGVHVLELGLDNLDQVVGSELDETNNKASIRISFC
eukprot:gene22038-26549_t